MDWTIGSQVVKGIIYMISSDKSPKVYIGQTRNALDIRWNQHTTCGKKLKENENNADKVRRLQNSYLYKAMAYHGIEHFKIAILEEPELAILDAREIFYIKLYNSQAPNGYNLTSGGTEFTHCEESIRRIKERKHELIDQIRNEKLQGLPPKTAYRNNATKGEQIVFNNHPRCKHKTFSSVKYGSFENAKEAALTFYKQLEDADVIYVKPKQGDADLRNRRGFIQTKKGYRVNKVHKGITYDKRFERKDRTLEENKQAAEEYYNKLLRELNINQ